MSFGSGSTDSFGPKKPNPLGLDPQRFSSHEQARPVPYFAGKRRIAVTHISNLFGTKKQSVTRDTGKQKTRTGTSYFTSFAALVAHGPVDSIHEIILNGERVWTGTVSRGGGNPDYADITITNWGIIRFYWGTETQTRDSYIAQNTTPEHPAYKGISYLVAKELFLGFNQTSVQNMEVVVSRFPAFGTVQADVNGAANPVNVFVELLTNRRFGRGLEGVLDEAALDTVGDQLATEKVGVSPLMDSQQDGISTIVTLLEHIDGYPVVGSSGLLSIGLVRPVADHSTLPVVDESVMTEPLDVSPDDWSSTLNAVSVKFTDPANNYESSAKTWRDRGNFAVTGEVNHQTIERPWVTTAEFAAFLAQAIGRTKSLPEAGGTIQLRRTALFSSLAPGALFKLDYPPRGYTGLVCRVTDRTVADPARPVYSISFKIDRSYLINDLSIAAAAGGGFSPASDPTQIAEYRVVELPQGLVDRPSLAVICARPQATTAGAKIHLGINYDWTGYIAATSYQVLDAIDQFAMHGTLTIDLPAGPVIEDSFKVLLDGVDVTMEDVSEFDGLANELLCFVNGEILSVLDVVTSGQNLYSLTVVRGRFGSPIQSHVTGDEVFIIAKNSIRPLQHPQFLDPGNKAALKIQAVSGTGASVIGSAPAVEHTITGRFYAEPALGNLSVGGNAVNPSYSTGQSISIAWSMPDSPYREPRVVYLEFWNAGNTTLLGSTTTPGPALTLSNSELQTLLGGSEVSFILKARLRTIGDWWQVDSQPITLAVSKV